VVVCSSCGGMCLKIVLVSHCPQMLLWTYRLWVVLAFGKPSWALYSVMFLLFYEEDKESQKEMDTY
jgi:hypothetical protein